MKLHQLRKLPSANSTQGKMTIDGIFECFTLEPPPRPGNVKPRAIAAGAYPVTLRHSPRFGRIMPHIENVPGFEGVEIHWGNYPKDTVGCTLVGRTEAPDFVGESRIAFDALFVKLQRAIELGESITIDIEDAA